jgi:hypothetical protein
MLQMRQQGYLANLPEVGPAYEVVTFVGLGHPLRPVVAAVCLGRDRFTVGELLARMRVHPYSKLGLQKLSRAGLAIKEQVGDLVTLQGVDRRAARLINASRRGGSRRGFRDRFVIEAILLVRNPNRRWIRVTDGRRISAAWILAAQWDIDADDLLDCKRHVHLVSRWQLPPDRPAEDRQTA